jgi:NAD(P)-dependent dehydrogenase (short-subunit alcohol dehydrogenase family)
MNETVNISGKVILLTGAFGLIGSTLVDSFLSQGAKVILADTNKRKAEKITLDLKKAGFAKKSLVIVTDVTKLKSCNDCIAAAVKKFKSIDVLINNAAIDAKFDKQANAVNNATRFENFPLDKLQQSFDVNVKGLMQITQLVIKQMLKQGYGNIINVASTYSLVAPNQSLYDFGTDNQQYKPVDYVITKSVIPNLTKYIATFYAKDNIRCNAIAPHGIFNNHETAFLNNFSKLSPMGRMSDKSEMTGPFTFLASDASSYMTGSVLTVDGGWTAW